MSILSSVEVRLAKFNQLYESALARSNWKQIEAGQKTPAEDMAMQIASLQMRCSKMGPNPVFDPEREKVAIAASYFLLNRFGVGAHWDGLPETFAASVAMNLLQG